MKITEHGPFCVGAYEVAPGLFFGVAREPAVKHRVAVEQLLGWKYHDSRCIVTTVEPFTVIGNGLQVTSVVRDPERSNLTDSTD